MGYFNFNRRNASLGLFLATSMLTGLLQSRAQAQAPLSDAVISQIQSLQQEKNSRTPAQQKMDSQLIYAAKMQRHQPIAPGVPTLQTDVAADANGMVLVDIKAVVTSDLLKEMVGSGAVIINSFPQYDSIRARVPLTQVEAIAGLQGIKFIQPAVTYDIDRVPRQSQSHSQGGVKKSFKERAAELRDRLPRLMASLPKSARHTLSSAAPSPDTGSVDSEGDTTHDAIGARATYNIDGTGIKVGVLSDSVDNLAAAQASNNLGPVTVLTGQGFTGQGASGEGTAMLEIIHDLAPGATLYFATADNGVAQYAQNIRDLRTAGCDIIVDDVVYNNEPAFQDGPIALAVDDVTAAGALYFGTVRNAGSETNGTSGAWEGDFVDGGATAAPLPTGANIHSFGALNYDTVLSGGSQYRVDLLWADPLGQSSNDYDLYVLSADGNTVVLSSTNIQNGTQDPYENVPNAPIGDRIVIVKNAGAQARFLHIDTGRGRLSIHTAGRTRGHATAAAAFSVAAVDVHNTNPFPSVFAGGAQDPVESFSSDGPRRVFYNPDGSAITPTDFSSTGGVLRQKPDIAAADGVSTSSPTNGLNPFYGTSAAAPHAAAIAALVKSYVPSATPAELRLALTSTALDIMAAGVDRDSGVGIVMPKLAIQALASLGPHLILQNDNQVAFWYVNNATITGSSYALGAGAPFTIPPEFRVVASGDFNGDGKPDVVLQNTTTAEVVVWFTNGPNVIGSAYVTNAGSRFFVPSGWQIVGAGDFDGDGKADIVMENQALGQVGILYCNGTDITSGAYVIYNTQSDVLPPNYHVLGVGDFNADGKPDLVVTDTSSGVLGFWLMNNSTLTSGAYERDTAGNMVLIPSGWAVQAVGDYNHDGSPDLVLQNMDGSLALWSFLGTTLLNGAYMQLDGAPAMVAPTYNVLGPR